MRAQEAEEPEGTGLTRKLLPRVIPTLLLRGNGLVKTIRFKNPRYVGDPLNCVRIFNEKECDELVFLDIDATPAGREPNFQMISNIASECFMPFAYGGGIRTLDHVKRTFDLGAEKIVINTAAYDCPELVAMAAEAYGNQAVVVSIDAKKTLTGRYQSYSHGGRRSRRRDPAELACEMERCGAGEILLNSIDRDGRQNGYDLELIRRVARAVRVPIVACGSAGRLEDFRAAVADAGASAVGAGSFFVFEGKHRAVLITYPERKELEALWG